jgi:hypothetical protein
MIIWRLLLALALLAGAPTAQQESQSFVRDASKPYVYIKFDHTGPREPLSPDEPTSGLWLRLVNNCRVPIIIGIFNPGTGDPGIGLFDNIIPIRPRMVPGRLAEPKQGAKPREALPAGYSSEVFSTTTIEPGSDILFSVPVNHVSAWWHMQIVFNLDVGGAVYGSEPYNVVSFYWQDIPEKFREPGPVSASPKPTTR